MMRFALFVSSLVVIGCTGSLLALSGVASEERYLITEVENGILRVDRQTGEVTLCQSRDGKWGCEIVPEERAMGFSAPAENDFDNADDLTKEDVDQAIDTFEYMVDRLVGAAGRMRDNPNLYSNPQTLPAPSR